MVTAQMKKSVFFLVAGTLFAQADANAPINKLSAYLNQIGIAQAEKRAQAVAAIRTRAEATEHLLTR